MKYTIGVDYGTKSGRAVVVETGTGLELSSAVKSYTHGVMSERLPDGTALGENWALQHPKDYLEVLEEVVPKAVKDAGIAPEDVIGIAVDFTSCTVLPIYEDGTPLCFHEKYKSRPHAYVKLWKHHASQKAANNINQVLQEEGELENPRYGGRVSPELMLPRVLEIIDGDYEIYEEADEILEAMDWLTLLLTGRHRRSLSAAGYKAMYLPGEGYPAEHILYKINPLLKDVAAKKLGTDICPLDEKIGTLNREWAEKLGLKEGIAVAPGIIDSHVGMAGCGITSPGKLMLILGTSSVMLTLSERPFSDKGVVGAVKGGIIPSFYALESGLAAVGDLFEWMVDTCVPAGYMEAAEKEGKDIHTYLSGKAEGIGAGNTGLMVLGWWSGNKTPYVNGELRGVIAGLNMGTRPEQIYRALIEATAYDTLRIVDALRDAGLVIDSIVACGGIANKNRMLMQIYADVLNCEIRLSASAQTAALGAAMYAAVAAGSKAGGYDRIDRAAENMCRLKDAVFIPNRRNHEIYMDLYEEYRRMADYFGRENNEIYSRIKMNLLRGDK